MWNGQEVVGVWPKAVVEWDDRDMNMSSANRPTL